MNLRVVGIVAFGCLWFVVTGFLSFAAWFAGNQTPTGLILLLIVPYVIYARIWCARGVRTAANLFGLTVAAMVVATALLIVWERVL